MSNVLEIINKLESQSAIVIRHAERYDLCTAEDYWTCGLTGNGMAQAKDFGRGLAHSFDSYRIFYSPVERCQQTAETIGSSLEAAGKKLQNCGPERQLSVLSYMHVDEVQGFQEADRFGSGFIRAWFDGEVNPAIYKTLQEAKDDHLAYLKEKFESAEESNHLDIHVTHDWNINVLREGIFGIRHENGNWPDFLAGLGFRKSPFNAIVLDRGRVVEMDLDKMNG